MQLFGGTSNPGTDRSVQKGEKELGFISMPSGSKRRKSAKKKKDEVVVPACHEDSANERDHDHGNDNEDDGISPKTPVQAREGDGSSPDAESGSPTYDGSKQEEQIQENSFPDTQGYQNHPVESTDISLGVVHNRSESSCDILVHDNNGLTESPSPFTDAVEPHPEEDTDIKMKSSVQSSEKYSGDETQESELDARTDVASVFTSSEIVGGDESKLQVLSSGEVEDKHKEIQSAGSFTDLCGHFLAESSDITVGSQSNASEVSDDDESKLEVVSSTAVVDPNESVQSLGSVDSPRSFQSMNCQRFSEHNSYDTVILTSQEQECESEGVLETPWKELSSEANIPVSLVHVDDSESPEDQDGQINFSNESSLDFRNDEQIHVTNEVRNISHATLEEGLAETQGASLISSVASVTESELTCKVKENNLLESDVTDVALIKTESSEMITEPMISTGGEISRDDFGSSQVEDSPTDTKENATGEATLYPQNAGQKDCIVFESPQDQDGQANSLFKESSSNLRNEEHGPATVEGLTKSLSNSEQQTQGSSLISSVVDVTESGSTCTVEENTLLESNAMAMPLIKTESSNAITELMIFAGREISRDDLGFSQVEDNPTDTKENATGEAVLYPQNAGNEACIVFESPQGQDEQANSLFKESSLDFRNEEHIQVTNEVSTVSPATVEGLTEFLNNCEQTQGASLISSVASVTESESTRTVEEDTLLESNVVAMPLIITESSEVTTEPMISAGIEIRRDDSRSPQVEDDPSDTKNNTTEEVELHPQNVGKEACFLFGSPHDPYGQVNSLFKASSLELRCEEHIHVTNEAHTDNHDTLEGLTESLGNFEQTQGVSLISSVAAVTESESPCKVKENALLESNEIAVTSIKTESGQAITEPMISTSREINRDDLGSSQVELEDNPNDTKENATEEAALHLQNVGDKNDVLLQREPRTSWMSCCGIFEIFTGSHG